MIPYLEFFIPGLVLLALFFLVVGSERQKDIARRVLDWGLATAKPWARGRPWAWKLYQKLNYLSLRLLK